jgi:hypothetical protein
MNYSPETIKIDFLGIGEHAGPRAYYCPQLDNANNHNTSIFLFSALQSSGDIYFSLYKAECAEGNGVEVKRLKSN